MCLILIGNHVHPDYPLVIAANRDEYFRRPARRAGFWDDNPAILAGRDLEKGGTWLGVNRDGRMAAVTNYREPPGPARDTLSRGFLVRDYLAGDFPAAEYLARVARHLHRYEGFNLCAGDQDSLYFLSSYLPAPNLLDHGIHGISNGDLNYPWPKVIMGKSRFEKILADTARPDETALFELLADRTVPEDLPAEAGETARMLAPVFVQGGEYGTRSSTLLLFSTSGWLRFVERTFDRNGAPVGSVEYKITR